MSLREYLLERKKVYSMYDWDDAYNEIVDALAKLDEAIHEIKGLDRVQGEGMREDFVFISPDEVLEILRGKE